MPRVTNFEVTADDPERAVRFYADVFGWLVEKWQGRDYWQCSTGEEDERGINGAVMAKPAGATGTIVTVDVPDIEMFVQRVRDAGGEVLQERFTVPYVGYQAYCRDTEGNVFGLMQYDAAAKP
jgi:predicted enzyme related to lactoylglutathione lyase